MKILVVEDERVTRLVIVARLREWGHEVISAKDGLEAWELYQRERPRMIVTDWLMPGLDGIHLIERIRKASSDYGCYAYIMMLTTRSETADLVRGMDAGADDFISKPVANDELRTRIRAGVRIIELERSLERKNRFLAKANAEISEANQRMRRELEAAATIQNSFLPSGSPRTDRARFAWHYEPCENLSGDTLNILPLDENRIGLYMVDVCGHGVSAALLSVHVSRIFSRFDEPDSILRQGVGNGERPLQSPAAVAAHLNEKFPCDPSGIDVQYFTLLYGILDLEKNKFDYTSAGHPGPIIVPADQKKKPTIFAPDPPAVGFFKDVRFTQQSVSLDRGDRIYLFTDGIYETPNEEGEEFGELRLADELADLREAPLDDSIVNLLDTTREWNGRESLNDDVSLLGAEVA